VLWINGLRMITIDQGSIDCDLVGVIDVIFRRMGDIWLGMAHTFFLWA
jgi:hypothetical protein